MLMSGKAHTSKRNSEKMEWVLGTKRYHRCLTFLNVPFHFVFNTQNCAGHIIYVQHSLPPIPLWFVLTTLAGRERFCIHYFSIDFFLPAYEVLPSESRIFIHLRKSGFGVPDHPGGVGWGMFCSFLHRMNLWPEEHSFRSPDLGSSCISLIFHWNPYPDLPSSEKVVCFLLNR